MNDDYIDYSKPNETRAIGFTISEGLIRNYNKLYTKQTFYEFLRRCVERAIDDKEFFNSIYFTNN